jgi:RNA polymerase sigma factor (sigma-70 family)
LSEYKAVDMSITDLHLITQCANDDKNALEELFHRYERPVFGLLYRMLSNREDAEEALSEVFVKIWRHARAFNGKASFSTWMYTIAANTARDYLRKRMRKKEVSIEDTEHSYLEICGDSSDDPLNTVISNESKSAITDAITFLPEEDKLIITLYHIRELDYSEISKITGITPNKLKIKLFRARQRLRKICKDSEKNADEKEMRQNPAESTGLQQTDAEFAGI